jgi:hypothetical protein
MEEYTLLDEGIKKARIYALLGWRGSDTPAIKLERVTDAFIAATSAHDDDSALTYFNLVVLAVNDTFLAQYVVLKENRFMLSCENDALRNHAIKNAKYEAAIARAKKARELFEMIPKVQTKREWVRYDEDSGDYKNIDYPTLPKTKKAMLLEIANGWEVAQDQTTADHLVGSLLAIPLQRDEEEPLRVATFREITDRSFPLLRIIHTIAFFKEEMARSGEGVLRILVEAWRKHARKTDLLHAFRILEPISEQSCLFSSAISDAATELIRSTNGWIKAMDDAVMEMLQRTSMGDCTRLARTVEVRYVDLKVVEIWVKEEIGDQKTGIDSFTSVRDRLKKWLGANRTPGTFQVHLIYTGESPTYAKSKVEVRTDEML